MKQITESWFEKGSFYASKKSLPEPFEVASEDGVIETLEGPVAYSKGFFIMTGPRGERYPIPPEKFFSLKDDNGDGTATPKKIIKRVKVADHDGSVNTSWGEVLQYTSGVDVIVRHGPEDYGVVKKEIFSETYEREYSGLTGL